jgi:hypothetical protein
MLKGIPSFLNADLLWALAAMGHGDELAIVDRNFSADRVARKTSSGKLFPRRFWTCTTMSYLCAARSNGETLSADPLREWLTTHWQCLALQ